MGSFLVMTILVVGVAMPTPGRSADFTRRTRLPSQSFFGVPDDRAIGAAIVLHGVSFVPVTLLGLVFMASDGISLSRAAGSSPPRRGRS